MTSGLTSRLRDILGGDRARGAAASLHAPQPAGDAQASRQAILPVPASQAPASEEATRTTVESVGGRLAAAAARALGGEVRSSPLGPYVVVDRSYPTSHRHGLLLLGASAAHLDAASPAFGLLAGSSASADDVPGESRPLLFVDIETTGLAGGAGTHAFLVGCAWFDRDAFRVEQFFMAGHALERALLAAVRARLDTAGSLVTYNGRTFDVPVLETRYLFHRQTPPFGERTHLDMLPVARRLWRFARPVVDVPGIQTDSCALGALERVLFGVQRHGDVPGFEIPGRFFAFLRSGDASPLEPVLEHNRLDLVSLAVLTARALRLLSDAPDAAEQPRECLGLGRIFERVGLLDRAETCYARAIALGCRSWHVEDEHVAAEALRALAVRCRRAARFLEAAEHWQTLARLRHCPLWLKREALEALAIHHEHRSRDLEQARLFAEQSERLAEGRAEDEARRRVARLRRKLDVQRPCADRRGSFWN